MYCSGQLIPCLKISGNKNNLRTIEAEIAKKLRTAQPQPKVTGSYKNKRVSHRMSQLLLHSIRMTKLESLMSQLLLHSIRMTKLESLLMLLKEILKKKLRNLTQAVTKKLKQAALTKMTQCFKLPKSEDTFVYE